MAKELRNLLLMLTVLMSFTAIAQEQTWSFGWEKSKSNGGEGFYDLTSHKYTLTTTLNGISWTISSDSYYYGYTAGTGQLIGSNANPASWVSLNTSGIPGKIKSVEVKARCYDKEGVVAHIGVEVNGARYQCGGADSALLTPNYTPYQFTPAAAPQEGKIDIKLSQTAETKCVLYIRSITIVYENAATGVEAPTISLLPGTYDAPQEVTLSTSYGDAAKIYYTLDGSNPNVENGTRIEYAGPFQITETGKLSAVTVKDGASSQIVTADYVIRVSPGLYWEKEEHSVVAGYNDWGNFLNNPNHVAPITYKSDDETVAVVGANGDILGINPGQCHVSATFAGNETYLPQTASYKLTVTPKAAIPAPVITPAGGTFDAPVEVTITTVAPAKAVWYSTTASTVDELIDNPVIVKGLTATVTIDRSCTLAAVGVDYDNVSEMATATFQISEPTAVSNLTIDRDKKHEIYTIDGRRVVNPKAGLYIVDGKKVIVK